MWVKRRDCTSRRPLREEEAERGEDHDESQYPEDEEGGIDKGYEVVEQQRLDAHTEIVRLADLHVEAGSWNKRLQVCCRMQRQRLWLGNKLRPLMMNHGR